MLFLAGCSQAKDIAVSNQPKNISSFGSRFFVSPRAAIFAIALASVSTAGFAAGTPEQRQACTGDVFRLCSSDIPNVDRIVACLKRQRTSLSPGCQAVFGTETASATRSVSGGADYCAFSAEHTSAEHQQWRSWCAAR
jgi:hypothetical protein